MPKKTLIFKINILENVTGTTKTYFYKDIFMKNLMIEYKICVTVLVFFFFFFFVVLVTFLKNPEKSKDYNKCCLPFQPIFCLSTPYVYHWVET